MQLQGEEGGKKRIYGLARSKGASHLNNVGGDKMSGKSEVVLKIALLDETGCVP